MIQSHDDIEHVKRLLEEKERDLELTAQIGKELLEQNQLLERRISEFELEVKISNESLAQLSHELHQKNELVAILTSDLDDNNSENGTPTGAKSINIEVLQKKITQLEEENKALRQEASLLAIESTEVEEQEKRLMADISNQLYTTNSQFDDLRLELERHKEENQIQHEQIVALSTRLTETELRLHQLTTENEEQCSLLGITKENQNLLAIELGDFKTKYQEVVSLLNETQEQLRRARKRTQPVGRTCPISGPSALANDSLQYELLETTFSDSSLDSGISLDRTSNMSYKNVFETVKCVSRTNTIDNSMPHLGAMAMSSSTQPMMSAYATQGSLSSYNTRGTTSIFSNTNYPNSMSLGSELKTKTLSKESIMSEDEHYPPQAPAGTPGVPGARDLEAALKRLTPAEVLARRAMLQYAPVGTYNYEDNQLGTRTPDSIMSTGLSSISGLSTHSQQWRLPEKLQIIKPLEGSLTLSHWSRLATPTLSGLLEERPGVTIRGGRGLDDLGLQTYSLSDVEEDVEDHPGKRFQSSTCVYTFTNSTVMHPDDGSTMFSMPASHSASQITSYNSSRNSSAPQTPRSTLSRRNSCSTFSVSICLASMLNERGIKAVTPSALNTPCGQNFSPTVTPCNSPEGSPPRCMSPEPQFLTGILNSGADLLRRKLIGEAEKQQTMRARNKIQLSRLEKRALKSIKILEKVESIGIDNIIPTCSQTAVSPLSFQNSAGFYSSHSRSASPMTQLTSLKNLAPTTTATMTSNESGSSYKSDEVRINRDAIKAILSKGLSCDSIKTLSETSSDCSSSVENKVITTGVSTSHVSSAITEISTTNTNENNRLNENRMKQLSRQKSRRNMVNGRQRPDLGKINNSNIRPDLGTVSSANAVANSNAINNNHNINNNNEERSQGMGFVGTISSLLFGRKGGLL